jgi:pimeloyl-ACP methyl ester carboxylesterase
MGGSEYDGWDLREAGPVDADRTVLLLAGAMCPASFYDGVMAVPALGHVRMVAAALPGFAGTRRPADLTVEGGAAYAAALARTVGADVVVGHSLGANHVLEMVASGQFTGPVVLLSPSFSAADEMRELKALAKVGTIPGVGRAAWAVAMKLMPKGMAKSLPERGRAELVAGMPANDAGFCRAAVREYLDYLDRRGPLVDRLCASRVPTWVVFGDHDEVGLSAEERASIDACATITLVAPLESTHFVMLHQPERCAEMALEALAAAS